MCFLTVKGVHLFFWMFARVSLRNDKLFLLTEHRNSLVCYPSPLGTGTDPSVTTYPNLIRDRVSPTDLVHHGSKIETVDVPIYVCAETKNKQKVNFYNCFIRFRLFFYLPSYNQNALRFSYVLNLVFIAFYCLFTRDEKNCYGGCMSL